MAKLQVSKAQAISLRNIARILLIGWAFLFSLLLASYLFYPSLASRFQDPLMNSEKDDDPSSVQDAQPITAMYRDQLYPQVRV